MAIAGGIAGGATITAGVIGSHAANHAGDLNAHAASDQLAYLSGRTRRTRRIGKRRRRRTAGSSTARKR
jgi:hypothetical protein